MISKKKVCIALLVSLCISLNSFAEDSYVSGSNNGYKDVVFDSTIGFKAYRDGAVIKMQWSQYSEDDFSYYKLMRSETNDNPIYPDQAAFQVVQNSATTELKIHNYDESSAVYRVCVITQERGRFCSNIVKLPGYTKEEKTDYNTKKDYKKEKPNITTNKNYKNTTSSSHSATDVNSNSAQKAKMLVEKFIERIENKFVSNSDRINAIDSTIEKLNTLGNKNQNFKRLIEYIVQLLSTKKEKYDSGLEEIESIFNDI